MMNHLWQSTLFAVAIGLLALAFRRHRAAIRYALWLAASLKFLIPFAPLMDLGTHLPPPAVAPPALTLAAQQTAQPFPETLDFSAAPAPTNWLPMLLWACGFAVVVTIRLRGWFSIRAAVRAGTALSLPVPIAVRSTPGLIEPGIVGIWKPVLLLPAGLLQRLTLPQLQSVLAHELCHVRRRDNLTAALHMLVEALFWFHPAVWWIGARLIEERERACDETVVSQGHQPQVYAHAILGICKHYVESPLACAAGVTGADLHRRVARILANQRSRRLNLARKLALAAAALTAVTLPIALGIAQSVPRFDVASVRPCQAEPGRLMGGGPTSPGRLIINCTPLVDERSLGLIQRAYVRFAQGRAGLINIIPIVGGPAWMRSEHFQIQANAEGQPSAALMQGPMLQALLEDRFKLRLHRETRQMPVYGLTLAKGGPKLKPFVPGTCLELPRDLAGPPPPPPAGAAYCRMLVKFNPPAIVAEGANLDQLLSLLNLVLDRPALNQTGLTGRYSINLEFAAEGTQLPPNPDSTSLPSIFTAIQEQLGLRLAPTRGPREFIVIDHIERPSEN